MDFETSTIIIAGCSGHGNRDRFSLGPGSARVISERGDIHFWVIRRHEFSGDVCFLIWALFLQLDFRMRYIHVFSKFFCCVNESACPFESRTRRRIPPRMNFVINFFCSYLMSMSLHYWFFPSLMVHFNLCSFNVILYKSLDEKILVHVGIRAFVFDLNCLVWMLTKAKHK